jgi:hypothetical protein
MAISANILEAYFREYRISPMAKKKNLIDLLLGFEPKVEKQKELLIKALNYDILNPVADGRENFLRSSEISVALFKRVFKNLSPDVNREEFLISVLFGLLEEAKKTLSQRQYTTKTGENLTKTITPFSIAYHLFLTMVFFDVSALCGFDFSRYSALLMEIQTLKNQLRRDSPDTTSLWFKLHNAITHLEQFKLNFLHEQYGLTIEMLCNACQTLYPKFKALVIKEDGNLASAETGAERLQLQILLELNKQAYGLSNTFGQLKFREAKPQAYSDEEFNVPLYSGSASEGMLSFWREKGSAFDHSRSFTGVDYEMRSYYNFAS